MRDYARAAGIVDQDVEPALGGTDRGGEAFDGARILRRGAARAGAGTGQAGNQPVGRLGIAPKGDYDTGPGLREEACGRSTQAFAAACHQSYPSVEHAHDLSFKATAIQKLPDWHRILSLWSWTAVRARGVWLADVASSPCVTVARTSRSAAWALQLIGEFGCRFAVDSAATDFR